jgi:nitroimidazol reductase NimA-like FMN-containing flavoprotein (pyridoxamine 5'-phosphate oxidase superfamily)
MNDDTRAIFAENVLASLATTNADGSPWSTALHVATDDAAVYWLSSEDTIHSQNIRRDGRASLTLFSTDESHGPKGVYINGIAKQLDDIERTNALAVIEKRLGSIPKALEAAAAYRLPIGALDTTKSKAACWYFVQ